MSERLLQLKDFIKETPQDAFLHYAVAMELLKLERLEEAQLAFEGVIRDFPDYVGTYYHLGKLYERLDKKADAIMAYEKGMTVAHFAKNRHAFSEIQVALNQAKGLDEDEDW